MDDGVTAHYDRQDSLIAAIDHALAGGGHDLAGPELVDVLAGVDQFHLGGAATTDAVADLLDLSPGGMLVDIGAGIGGPARTFARRLGCRVHGIDLTPSFVATATTLAQRLGMADRVTFAVGDALALDLADGSADAVTVMHVGMNIADKPGLMAEVARVLRPGGQAVAFDVMRTGAGEVSYPMPWASDPAHSHLASVEDYTAAMNAAGLEVGASVDLTDTVLAAIDTARRAPGPLSLTTLMGPEFPAMFANLTAALAEGTLAPVALHGRRPT